MSFWYSSWLPSLPSIEFALPSSIQRRFISFVLRKLLGHLLKPGQLDVHQIDSQIGLGYVQVRDLELDNEAINTLISGLPIQLNDGSISSVTARIPWPNPLTSTVGFSLESLHLTFRLLPTVPVSTANVNLADSVVSVAESFIHNELTPREEATLRETFNADLGSSVYSAAEDTHNIPGGMDPFLSATEDEEFNSEVDPAGVSIFATLIERLLSRFEFDAVDTKVTLVHPGHSSFTVSISEIHYHTEARMTEDSPQGEKGTHDSQEREVLCLGQTRTISISGVTLTTRNLRPPVYHSPPPLTPSTPSPISPTASGRMNPSYHSSRSTSPSPSSSMDEDTQFVMSQSIVGLPPRPPSPVGSLASSLYHSAISTVGDRMNHGSQSRSGDPPWRGRVVETTPETSHPEMSSISKTESKDADQCRFEDEMILSFGLESIVICLTTSPLGEPPLSSGMQPSHVEGKVPHQSSERLHISVVTGVMACALRASHIRAVLDFFDAWNSHNPPPVARSGPDSAKPSSGSPNSAGAIASSLGLGIEANVEVRGAVLILLPSSSAQSLFGSFPDPLIGFFKRPLAPPRLIHGYMRVHLEAMSLSLSSLSSTPIAAVEQTRIEIIPTVSTTSATTTILTFSLTEIHILAFHSVPMPTDVMDEQISAELLASPILITDPHLLSQYPPSYLGWDPSACGPDQQQPQLPTFNVVDWTDERNQRNGMKISTWRTKLKPKPGKLEHLRRNDQIRMGDTLSGSHSDREQTPEMPNAPAVLATAKKVDSFSSKGAICNSKEVVIKIAPLHIFVDLAVAVSSDGALSFVEEILGPVSKDDVTGESTLMDDENGDADDYADEEGGNTPPATAGVLDTRESERDRRRLEQLVLEDLDLSLDYRQERSAATPRLRARKVKRKNQNQGYEARTSVVVKLAMIRIQARCPPPPARSRRSGAFVLDLHETQLISGRPPDRKPVTRFADSEPQLSQTNEDYGPNVLLSADCRNIVLACSSVGDSKAVAFLALGPVISVAENAAASQVTGSSPLQPHVTVTIAKPTSTAPIPLLTHQAFALTVDVPSLHVDLSKAVLDHLQYWADDAAQVIERTFGSEGGETERGDSRDPSLIGSRFFAKSRNSESESGSRLSVSHAREGSETVLKIAISEAFIRAMLPRKEGSPDERPFNIFASNVDVLMELKPEGMDETVLTVGITDLNITDTSHSGGTTSLLSLTVPRSLTSSPKSLLKVRFVSLILPETIVKESRLKLTLWGFTFNLFPNFNWIAELGDFVKAPPGAFETVIPNERTRVSLKIMEGSIRVLAPTQTGALVFHIGDLDFSTDIVGNSQEFSFNLLVPSASILFIDTLAVDCIQDERSHASITPGGIAHWKGAGYALLAEVAELDMKFRSLITTKPDDTRVVIDRMELRLHLCADTMTAVAAFTGDLASIFKPSADDQPPKPKRGPSTISQQQPFKRGIMSSVDEYAFKRVPEVGPAPDMIYDDLPTNLDYLDESFGTAAGLRELRDDDLDEFDTEDVVFTLTPDQSAQQTGVISKVGGETIKILRSEGIHIIENFFDTLPPDSGAENSELGETTLRIRVHNCDVTLFLYDGYDWVITRKTIEKEVKEMRRKLAKIKQLVATGQTQDPSVEETSALLFNSVYIGLKQDVDELEPGALIAAIDEELNDDVETSSQSSWQSLKPSSAEKTRTRSTRVHGKRLTRSLGPSIEFKLISLDAEIDHYRPDESLVSRTFATVRDVEILDHIKTSTWRKFLTELRSDSRGNVRETDSNMVRVELRSVRPVPGHPSEEARLRAKILPLRLYVDQDALDFLKKFFSFQDPHNESGSSNDSDDSIFFQFAEVFPVDLKLDYKPRRVDYRALREGRTIELMNFFHFDGAEMTLRHITLAGITGWSRFFDMLNDLWTPDVKATQLVEVISGVSPIRSVVNVGSGLADLVLLPIAQYKKDGRIVRGMQKGTTAFVKSTAMEAIKLGARLATGTQVILEQAEGVLGGQFTHAITAETLQVPFTGDDSVHENSDDDETADLISKYAQQPVDIREGVHSAYRSLQKNFSSAAQTILAVPMEVYERSGNEGPVRAVIRAVPIAVLKPMIGASEAVSKTLLGLHNTLDPNVRRDNEAKYKYR